MSVSRRVRSAGGGTGQPVGPVGQQARAEAEAAEHGLAQVYHVRDLVALSVSSVGPLFSIAATGGVMAGLAGWWTLPSILVIAVPFVIAAFVFRLLNRHFPHAGASYHWSRRVMGPTASRFQAWVLILAYFTSIPRSSSRRRPTPSRWSTPPRTPRRCSNSRSAPGGSASR